MLGKISLKKVISWLVLIIITIFLFVGVHLFAILLPLILSVVVFLGVLEFCKLWEKKEYQIPKVSTIFFSILIIWDVYLSGGIYFEKILIIYLLGVPFFQVISKKKLPDLVSLSLGIFALIYIAGLLSYTLRLWQLTYSVKYLLLVMLLIVTSDTFCYLGGVLVGKRKIFPNLSPKKTLEGWISGILFTVLASFILCKVPYFNLSFFAGIILAILVGVFGQIGDVFESAIKRSVSAKDSGSLIPEHGGILDRIDSTLLVAILSYYFLFYAVYK